MNQHAVNHPLWNKEKEKDVGKLQKWIYDKFRYEFNVIETFFLWMDISNELSEEWLDVSDKILENAFIQKYIHQFAQNKLFN